MPDSSRIQYFPVSFFAMVMGLAGLTLAWKSAVHSLGLGLSFLPIALSVLTVVVFSGLLSVYVAKYLRYRSAVIEEIRHPVKSNFFAAISICLLLIATILTDSLTSIALVIWILGAALHISMTLYIMSEWIFQEHFEVQHMNPAWFIPVVGNVIVPIAGTELGYPEVSWFFFSVGMVFWVVLFTIIMNRVFFHHPIPARLMPTFFILIAPPAVGFVSYTRLVDGVDTFARLLFYVGLFLTLLLLTQFSRFAKLPFALSWWAYSFPMAAMTIATFIMAGAIQSGFLKFVAVLLLVLLTAIVAYLLWRTAGAAKAGKICQPE